MSGKNGSDQPSIFDRVLRGTILLALPWVSLQQQMLEILRNSISDAANVKPIQNFTAHELHALAMILDPSGRLRNLLGADFESRMQSLIRELFPKLTSASISAIQAQEGILKEFQAALEKLKDAEGAKTSSRGKAAGRSE